jgi:uncharacterized C2H2 Zn-finger protein
MIPAVEFCPVCHKRFNKVDVPEGEKTFRCPKCKLVIPNTMDLRCPGCMHLMADTPTYDVHIRYCEPYIRLKEASRV